MTDFQSQLEALINEAAKTEASEREKILRNSTVKNYNNDFEYTANYFGRYGGFKSGCEFLMPMIESLIETRNNYIKVYEFSDTSRLESRHNKDLLNLLRENK